MLPFPEPSQKRALSIRKSTFPIPNSLFFIPYSQFVSNALLTQLNGNSNG